MKNLTPSERPVSKALGPTASSSNASRSDVGHSFRVLPTPTDSTGVSILRRKEIQPHMTLADHRSSALTARKIPHAETFVGVGWQSFKRLKNQFQSKPANMEQYPPTIRGKQDAIGQCIDLSEMEGPGRPLISDFQLWAFTDLMSPRYD